LIRTQITARGLKHLLDSELAPRLVALDLRDNYLGIEGALVMAHSDRLGSLEELGLGRTYIGAEGAKALALARGLTRLRRLELGYDLIGAEGATALANSTAFPQLLSLDLSFSYLGGDGALTLARSEAWPRLACLDLEQNEITREGALALARSSTLPTGTQVFAAHNLWEQDAKALAEEPRLVFSAWPDFEWMVSGPPGLGGVKEPMVAAAVPPTGLPAVIEFRELWIWEFGLVSEFPTFLTPLDPSGNGKSSAFAWMDRAGLSAAGWYQGPDAITTRAGFDRRLAKELESRAASGERTLQIERLADEDAIVWTRQRDTCWLYRTRMDNGTEYRLAFWYDAALDAYFRPIAERTVRSLYFEPSN
jgi:hypothetical protein